MFSLLKTIILEIIIFAILSVVGFTIYGIVEYKSVDMGVKWLNTPIEAYPEYVATDKGDIGYSLEV